MVFPNVREVVIAALALLMLLRFAGCESERERELGQGVHPLGFADESSISFHGRTLRERDYPLNECSECHGQDYLGGDVGVSCSGSGACHPQGVEDCAGTCHGDEAGPLPATGAHQRHTAYCQECHPTPTNLAAPHVDGEVNIEFSGLAKGSGAGDPTWNAEPKTCSNTYCHGVESPQWEGGTALDCNGCHDQSPSHDGFARVVDESTCANCHAGSPEVGHLDGVLTIAVSRCNVCHGGEPNTGAPPMALDGSTLASSPAVGAHRRHLDSLLPGRIGKVVACRRCHVVPDSVLAVGHLDPVGPADVDLVLGDYDPSTGRCAADCHFDRDPGPRWSDDSGTERACNACHAFPPVLTRIGTRHPPTPPNLGACTECHLYTPNTHVDGEVNFL